MGYSSKHIKVSHYWPAREMPFEWCFSGGPIVTLDCMLAGMSVSILSKFLCGVNIQ